MTGPMLLDVLASEIAALDERGRATGVRRYLDRCSAAQTMRRRAAVSQSRSWTPGSRQARRPNTSG
jgi:hypothetical protein